MNKPWSRHRRYSRAAAYVMIAVTGVLSTTLQPPSVQQTTSPVFLFFYLWTSLLIVGGILSAIGAASGRWFGEYVGLWPLIVSFLAFALAVTTNGRGWSSAGSGFMLAGFAIWLYSRWLDVALLRKEAFESQREALRRASGASTDPSSGG